MSKARSERSPLQFLGMQVANQSAEEKRAASKAGSSKQEAQNRSSSKSREAGSFLEQRQQSRDSKGSEGELSSPSDSKKDITPTRPSPDKKRFSLRSRGASERRKSSMSLQDMEKDLPAGQPLPPVLPHIAEESEPAQADRHADDFPEQRLTRMRSRALEEMEFQQLLGLKPEPAKPQVSVRASNASLAEQRCESVKKPQRPPRPPKLAEFRSDLFVREHRKSLIYSGNLEDSPELKITHDKEVLLDLKGFQSKSVVPSKRFKNSRAIFHSMDEAQFQDQSALQDQEDRDSKKEQKPKGRFRLRKFRPRATNLTDIVCTKKPVLQTANSFSEFDCFAAHGPGAREPVTVQPFCLKQEPAAPPKLKLVNRRVLQGREEVRRQNTTIEKPIPWDLDISIKSREASNLAASKAPQISAQDSEIYPKQPMNRKRSYSDQTSLLISKFQYFVFSPTVTNQKEFLSFLKEVQEDFRVLKDIKKPAAPKGHVILQGIDKSTRGLPKRRNSCYWT